MGRPEIRKALTMAADRRGMHLSAADLEALVVAATDATTYWTDEQILMRLREAGVERSTPASLRKWCSDYNVPRQMMASAADVRAGLKSMTGRGNNWRGRLRKAAAKNEGEERP